MRTLTSTDVQLECLYGTESIRLSANVQMNEFIKLIATRQQQFLPVPLAFTKFHSIFLREREAKHILSVKMCRMNSPKSSVAITSQRAYGKIYCMKRRVLYIL